MTTEENSITFTRMAPHAWLMAMWKEVDDKTFGVRFDCFTKEAICNNGVADWHGREAIRENLRSFINKGLTEHHEVVEYLDSPSFKIFQGTVRRVFDEPGKDTVTPIMTHFFYMDQTDLTKVKHWIGAVGPAEF